MAKKPAIYSAKLNKIPIRIRNATREEFRKKLIEIPFSGYEVETLSDGRKICITKPGGKNVYGRMQIHDFMVWIYNESKNELWRISHDEIFDDLKNKMEQNKSEAKRVILALKRVHAGEEPDEVIQENPDLGNSLDGYAPELILKVYKWIWGQEDCNYPTGEGRNMSMNAIMEEIYK
ncbi:MAG: hypothetical protein O8C62_07450 [Candidatus Methanoperedens sp.]|nr:hypothetical protein [Candidatus Methanoperedens sp.]MCZ7399499.1 hypothetical protein [Candidatus Methanoperedens sp.]